MKQSIFFLLEYVLHLVGMHSEISKFGIPIEIESIEIIKMNCIGRETDKVILINFQHELIPTIIEAFQFPIPYLHWL